MEVRNICPYKEDSQRPKFLCLCSFLKPLFQSCCDMDAGIKEWPHSNLFIFGLFTNFQILKTESQLQKEPLSLQPSRESSNTRLFTLRNKELNLDTLLYASVTVRGDFTDMVLKVSNINLTKPWCYFMCNVQSPCKAANNLHQFSTLEGRAIYFDN